MRDSHLLPGTLRRRDKTEDNIGVDPFALSLVCTQKFYCRLRLPLAKIREYLRENILIPGAQQIERKIF